MGSLQVRELPEDVYTVLCEQARIEHRSMAQQAVVALERGLGLSKSKKDKRRDVLRVIRSKPLCENADTLKSPVEYIREDRDR